MTYHTAAPVLDTARRQGELPNDLQTSPFASALSPALEATLRRSSSSGVGALGPVKKSGSKVCRLKGHEWPMPHGLRAVVQHWRVPVPTQTAPVRRPMVWFVWCILRAHLFHVVLHPLCSSTPRAWRRQTWARVVRERNDFSVSEGGRPVARALARNH